MAHIQRKTYRSKKTGKAQLSWQARYTAPDGRDRTKRFERKVDAENWLTTNGADVVRGDWLDPAAGRVGFRQWAESWKTTTGDLRPSTRVRDLGYLDWYIMPTFGNRTLSKIDHMEVTAWVTQLTTSGPPVWWDTSDEKNEKKKVKPLAPTTAVKAAQILSKIMATAVRAWQDQD